MLAMYKGSGAVVTTVADIASGESLEEGSWQVSYACNAFDANCIINSFS